MHVPADHDELAGNSGASFIRAFAVAGRQIERLVAHRECDVELPGEHGEQRPRALLRHVAKHEPDPDAVITHHRGIVQHGIREDALARANPGAKEQPGEADLAGLSAGRENPP